MTNSEVQSGTDRNTRSGITSAEPEEKTSRQISKSRVSTSTKLPGTNRVTPLVDNG